MKKKLRQLFLLKKHVSHNFTLIKAEKTQKHFSTPFFKNFYKFWSPYRVKAEKTQKHFSTPYFKNFYKFWSPYRVKISIFEKKLFRQLFLLKKLISHNFTFIKAKKTQKKVSTPFFKNVYKFWSPYRVKAEKTQKHFQPHFSKIFTSSDPHIG